MFPKTRVVIIVLKAFLLSSEVGAYETRKESQLYKAKRVEQM